MYFSIILFSLLFNVKFYIKNMYGYSKNIITFYETWRWNRDWIKKKNRIIWGPGTARLPFTSAVLNLFDWRAKFGIQMGLVGRTNSIFLYHVCNYKSGYCWRISWLVGRTLSTYRSRSFPTPLKIPMQSTLS